MTQTAVEQHLRQAGLRVTRQRVAVLEAIAEHSHPDADQIIRDVRDVLGRVSTQAVYDALHSLADAGLLRRVEPAGSPARFERRVGDNHHHLVCRVCGTMTDVDCTTGLAPCLEPVTHAGYVIDEAEITFWGTCPACQTN